MRARRAAGATDVTSWRSRLLEQAVVGHLAISIRDRPDIFPSNHVVDRGDVVIRPAEGTKLAAAVLGRGVAFEVDGVDEEARRWLRTPSPPTGVTQRLFGRVVEQRTGESSAAVGTDQRDAPSAPASVGLLEEAGIRSVRRRRSMS